MPGAASEKPYLRDYEDQGRRGADDRLVQAGRFAVYLSFETDECCESEGDQESRLPDDFLTRAAEQRRVG